MFCSFFPAIHTCARKESHVDVRTLEIFFCKLILSREREREGEGEGERKLIFCSAFIQWFKAQREDLNQRNQRNQRTSIQLFNKQISFGTVRSESGKCIAN
jgi:hypothetical protein